MLSVSMLRLDVLPQGVTGFNKPAEVPVLPVGRFHAACKVVVRHVGGFLQAVTGCEGQVAVNYHHAEVRLDGRTVSVLCHYCHPFLAFVPPDQAGWFGDRRTFLAPGVIGQSFLDLTDFRPLAPLFLQTPLTPELLAALGPGELHELHHWHRNGGTVGDAMFNNWD